MDNKGFTLIELIAVLAILGILGTIAAVKMYSFGGAASERVAEMAIEELNVREKMHWTNAKMSGEEPEAYAMAHKDWDIGDGTVNASGTAITVGEATIPVVREPATYDHPAHWKRN
jgi:prepilin-type N-terminal cleavage/methylation domain